MTLTRRHFLSQATIMLGAAALLGFPLSPAAAARSPEDYVKSLTNKVVGLANSGATGKALKSRFASLLNDTVNMRSIANFALGPYKSKLKGKDAQEFHTLVSNYAASLFVYYVDDFKGKELEITDVSTQGNFTTIKSAIIRSDGGREMVRWRLTNVGGSYKVSDVNLKGVWMTISMRKRFNDVLNRSKGDFKVLFEELREAETW